MAMNTKDSERDDIPDSTGHQSHAEGHAPSRMERFSSFAGTTAFHEENHLRSTQHHNDGMRISYFVHGETADGKPVSMRSFLYEWRGSAVFVSFAWTLLISICVSVIEWIPGSATAVLLDWKFAEIDRIIELHGVGPTLGVNLAFGILFGSIGTLACYVGGYGVSGSTLPDLMSYAACGYTTEDVFTFKVLVWKMVSIIFVIAAGTCVGREGPSIFLGAAVAYVVGKIVNRTLHVMAEKTPDLHTTLNHLNVGKFDKPYSGEFMHEVVMLGASAGFACAFGAPIGGMLFIYEEISSHWTQHAQMTSRIVFAVGVSVAFLNLLNNSLGDAHKWNSLYHSIIVYEEGKYNIDMAWHYQDILFFFPMAIYIGLSCGIMSRAAMFCTSLHQGIESKELRMLMYLLVVIFTVTTFTVMPYAISPCRDMPAQDDLDRMTGVRRFVRYGSCPEGTYNELASLTLSSEEDAIKHLFSRDDYYFDLGVLFVYAIIYSISFSMVMGSYSAAGNFTPNVLIGSVTGRCFGEIARIYMGTEVVSHPGVYAVVGATCQLVSWTRAVPAIVVTMFEVTSDTSLVVPMILCSMLSRSMTNLFGLDGWTHRNFHSKTNLPHHRVRPEYWVDMDEMDPEERSVHPPSLHLMNKFGKSKGGNGVMEDERYTHGPGHEDDGDDDRYHARAQGLRKGSRRGSSNVDYVDGQGGRLSTMPAVAPYHLDQINEDLGL